MRIQKECESCLVSGEHTPAITKSINPDFSGYELCQECATEYDNRITKITYKKVKIGKFWYFDLHTTEDGHLISYCLNGMPAERYSLIWPQPS